MVAVSPQPYSRILLAGPDRALRLAAAPSYLPRLSTVLSGQNKAASPGSRTVRCPSLLRNSRAPGAIGSYDDDIRGVCQYCRMKINIQVAEVDADDQGIRDLTIVCQVVPFPSTQSGVYRDDAIAG
jgi:hypothetical protein